MQDEDFEIVSSGESKLLILGGIYPAQVSGHHRRQYVYRGKPVEKLVFELDVFLSKDRKESVSLSSYYNIQRGGGGRYHFGPCSNYYRDWVAANDKKHPGKSKSLPIATFCDKLLYVYVGTVTTNGEGVPLNPSNYYSRVLSVLRPVEDGEDFERLPIQLSDFKWKTS